MSIRRMAAAALVTTLLALGFAPSAAHAASSSAGRDNFYHTCDAQVHVSDGTTAGKVEVFGGWGCRTDQVFVGTLVCIIYVNGAEKLRTSVDLVVASTKDCSVSYPDYSSSDSFLGKLIVKGAGGVNFTLTTGSIRT